MVSRSESVTASNPARQKGMTSIILLASLLVAPAPSQQTGPGIRDSLKNLYTIKKGYQSTIRQQGLRPIYTENQFRSYWTQSTGQPGNMAPAGIDWVKQMVLAVHLGQRNTGGFDVDVMRIDTTNGVASVLVRERRPDQNMIVTQALTSPWAIVRFDRTTLPFRMELTQGSQGSQVFMPNGGTVIKQGGLTISMGNSGPYQGYGDGWAEYDNGVWCDVSQPYDYVLSSQAEFTRYCMNVRGRRLDQVPANIDWTTEKLVAIHVGERPNPGYRIQISKIEIAGGQGVITATEVLDPNFIGVTGKTARPFVMVKVSRAVPNWKVVFKK